MFIMAGVQSALFSHFLIFHCLFNTRERSIQMSSSTYKNYRIGSFVGVNTGKIIGCSANVLFKSKYHGAGFVYDNDGTINNSLSLRTIRGSGKLGGFYYRNNGQINNCGWIGRLAKPSKENAQRYQDEELCIPQETKAQEIYSRLALGTLWHNEKDDQLEPDLKANMVAADSPEYIEISNNADLRQSLLSTTNRSILIIEDIDCT